METGRNGTEDSAPEILEQPESGHFRNGTDLNETLRDLDQGRIDPVHPPFAHLKVMRLPSVLNPGGLT